MNTYIEPKRTYTRCDKVPYLVCVTQHPIDRLTAACVML